MRSWFSSIQIEQPVGAAGADAAVPPHEPDPLLVQKILVAQRPDRAEIDHVARELVVQREAGHDVDFLVRRRGR